MLSVGSIQLDGLLYAATLLFFIFDPFASVPLFIAMTKGLDGKSMVTSANRAVLVAAILFVIFVLIGKYLLSMFGITIEGFRIAGGLVLLLMGMEIVFGLSLIRSGDQNVAWVIIATPILSGPGVISTAIILTVQLDPITVLLAGGFSLLITWILMRNAHRFVELVGTNVIDVFSKVVGLLVAAIGIEYMLRGITEWLDLYNVATSLALI
ncbi:MAG: MarC family protein [Euryarchaeota archaeon]|nr:MarC family protein [Euryarchaeota archaeon]